MIEITTFCPAFPGDKDKQLIKIIQVLSESIEKNLKKNHATIMTVRPVKSILYPP